MAYPTHPSAPGVLLAALPAKFAAAQASGELFYFPSEARDVTSSSRRFTLRICEALQDKAKAKADALARVDKTERSSDAKRSRRDDAAADGQQDGGGGDEGGKAEPFRPPYVPELYVGCLEGFEGEEGMSVLLNKYAVLPEHILLCPPSYAPQALPPTPAQLAAAHAVLVAAARLPVPRRMLGFYNGGEGAGASQGWRHFQAVDVGRAPVEDWCAGLRFDRLDKAVIHPSLPYLHIVHPLPPAADLPSPPTAQSTEDLADFLAPALMRLLDLAFDALRRAGGDKNQGWNLLMTLEHLHLIPRSLPNYPLGDACLELNALGYAGCLLVRSTDEERRLLDSLGEDGLAKVLETCGVPRRFGEEAQAAEEKYLGHVEEQALF
ncbi:bifunctional AP-4-A phosphorylase/ADP sulfurylase [Cryptotrichosporon argae]